MIQYLYTWLVNTIVHKTPDGILLQLNLLLIPAQLLEPNDFLMLNSCGACVCSLISGYDIVAYYY